MLHVHGFDPLIPHNLKEHLVFRNGLCSMKVDVAWLAGLLEGEGSFISGNAKHPPCIALIMTDYDIVKRVADWWRVTVNQPNKRAEHHKQPYRCQIRGGRALKWMKRVLPWMGVRRTAKINEIIASTKLGKQYSKLTNEQARIIQGRWDAGEKVKDLAKEFKIAGSTIYEIRKRVYFDPTKSCYSGIDD